MKVESLYLNNISSRLNRGYELKSVSMRMFEGEILGILGRSDSGMFALSKILAGKAGYDEGEIWLYGRRIEESELKNIAGAGICHITSAPKLHIDFTVAESICTTYPSVLKSVWAQKRKMNAEARKILKRYGLDIDVDKKTYQLSPYEHSMVEIMRAVITGCKVIIMENVLRPHEIKANAVYYSLLKKLAGSGMSVLIISTEAKVPLDIADRIIVMRSGGVYGSFYNKKLNPAQTEKLLERPQSDASATRHTVTGPTVLKLNDIEADGVRLAEVAVKRGEAVGFMDAHGNALSRLADILNGDEKYSGEIFLNGKKLTLGSRSVAVKNGIGYITYYEDPQMIWENMTIEENLFLLQYRQHNTAGFMNRKWISFAAKEYLEKYNIPKEYSNLLPSQVNSRIRAFIPRIRWEAAKPGVLVLNSYLSGMDSLMKADAFSYVQNMKEKGVAFIVCVSSGEEMLGLCDRVVVVD